jgi:hypothetical protein
MGGCCSIKNKYLLEIMDYFTGNNLSLCEKTEVGNLEIVCRYVYRILLKVKEGRKKIIYNTFLCT